LRYCQKTLAQLAGNIEYNYLNIPHRYATKYATRKNMMLQTYEATIDRNGQIRLKKQVRLPIGYRVLVTILDEPETLVAETALLSEAALAKDWNRPEEEEAWSHLQHDPSS
jgi:hypothetical protein